MTHKDDQTVGDVSYEILTYIKNKRVVYISDLIKRMTYKITASQLNILLDGLLEFRDDNGNPVLKVEKENGRTKYIYMM